MPLNPLKPHYAMENPASVYDEEALTALQLAGRTTAKVNETVEAFNKLETETGAHLKQQDAAIPEKVADEFQKRIKDGTFDNMIDKHVNWLSDRVDNLLGQVSEGSTSGDAELIDARTDANGNQWTNAGNNIRAMQNQTQKLLGAMTIPILEKVEKPSNIGYYDRETGAFMEESNYRCFSVDVTPGEMYRVKTIYGFSSAGAIVTDAQGNVIAKPIDSPYTTKTEEGTTPIVIPENGAKLLVSAYNTGTFNELYKGLYPLLCKVVGYENNLSGLKEYMENATANIGLDNGIFENAGTPVVGWLLGADGRPFESGADDQLLTTIKVAPGEIYHIQSQTWWSKISYAYYNTGDWPVFLGPTSEGGTITRVDTIITIPVGVGYLRVSGIRALGGPSVRRYTGAKTAPLGTWSNLSWCCVGDSLTEVNIRTDKHYFDYIQDKTGINVVNMGISGSGYKKREAEGYAFYQRMNKVPTTCDVVTIFGSGNDGGNEIGNPTDTGTDTLCGCINTTIDKLYEHHPTVKLGIVSPSPWTNQTPDDETCFMYKYSEALRAICERRGIPFLDMFRLTGFRPTAPDGGVNMETHALYFSKDPETTCCHPNELGHKVMSSHFYNFMTSLIGTY